LYVTNNCLIQKCERYVENWPQSYANSILRVEEKDCLKFFLDGNLLTIVNFTQDETYQYKERPIVRKDLAHLCEVLKEKINIVENNESDILFTITARCQLHHYFLKTPFFEEQKMTQLSFILADKFPELLDLNKLNYESIKRLTDKMCNYLKQLKPVGKGIRITHLQSFQYFSRMGNPLFSRLKNDEYRTDNSESYDFLLDLALYSQLA